MAVYIRGMKMPSGCTDCSFSYQSMYCKAMPSHFCGSPEWEIDGVKPDWCPLTEVKEPHGDLIDRDNLKRMVKANEEYFKDGECCSYFHNSADEPSAELWCVDEWIENSVTVIERSEDDEQRSNRTA